MSKIWCFWEEKLGADVTDMNIKLQIQIRVINRHIISYIIGRDDRCEYKATNELSIDTSFHKLWIDLTDVNNKTTYESNQ